MSPRVLIADDEEAIRLSLTRFFTRRGWAVETAADGHAALAALRGPDADRFTMILCDLRMPGMGGAELHEVLRAERPSLLARFVLASGDVEPEVAALVRSSPCRVLEKPFELEALWALAEELAADG